MEDGVDEQVERVIDHLKTELKETPNNQHCHSLWGKSDTLGMRVRVPARNHPVWSSELKQNDIFRYL